MSEMPKAYEPQQFEDSIYARWEESGAFIPENLPDFATRKPYTIMLPPPNATGTLHVGHSTMLAVQDALIRFNRMNGKRALWLPGTDHAALATQNKVEKDLFKNEKITRHDLGREELLKRIDVFVEKNRDRMTFQMRKMGSSLDWSREAFTLDEPRSRAVRLVFKQMFDDKLIYRGNRVINWCSRCASTLSDDELGTKTRKAVLYSFKYAKDFPITIASTQPETKLGDTGVAVYPGDARYEALVGKTIDVDFGGQGGSKLKIQIIADHGVEKDFGTGALGVTPAHSMVDYALAMNHNLPLVQIIGEDGLMTAAAGSAYEGLTIAEAREKVVAWLRAENLIEKEEEIEQNVPICERCETEITPLPKLQWFVSVENKFAFRESTRAPVAGIAAGSQISLKDSMRHVVETKQIKIVPERFEKTYFHWINNLRDWCISRQLWYGHRIPVWYCAAPKTEKCAEAVCSIEDISVCQHCGGVAEQDPDVLDTWFSSGMWTFTTLGWPYTRVIFVRHGEAETNVGDFLNSDATKEYHLTETGRAQVVATAEKLKLQHVDAIFASPLLRTQETAKIISDALGLPVTTEECIREAGMGEFEGKLTAEFEAIMGDRGNPANWMHSSPGGAETFQAIRERTHGFLDELIKTHTGKTIVVVSHGDPIWAAASFGKSGVLWDSEYPQRGSFYVREFDTTGSQVGDLNTYHPTDVLETGYDIIFQWVARMILMSTYALGEVPFKNVYLHGMVRDEQGRKMSKSLGNVLDPLDVIPKYGTDAVRLALLIGQTPGNDLKVSEEKIAGFRNFTNKLWNISRFILSQDAASHLVLRADIDDELLTTMDKWILSRLAGVTKTVTESLQTFAFSRAGEALRDFTWNELADWYLEGAKVEGEKAEILQYILQNLLKLWHPYMPFVTEAIWQSAYASGEKDFLMIAKWPDETSMPLYPEAEKDFAHVQNVIVAIRALRTEYKIDAKEIVPVTIITKYKSTLAQMQPVIERLARATLLFADAAPAGQLATVIEEGTITIPKPEAANNSDERGALEAEKENVAQYIATLAAKLANEDFLARAPAAVVEKEQGKLREAREKLAAIEDRLGA